MQIGKLYQINKYYWFLYPSKEIAATAVAHTFDEGDGAAAAAYLSKRFNCNVSHIEPNSIFVLLDQYGEYYKVLTTNGELGWIALADWYERRRYIGEVKV